MKRVQAQFVLRWRPARVGWAALAVLAACVAGGAGAVAWEHQRIAGLRAQVARLVADERDNLRPPTPHPASPYDASARQFLHERAAGWAPMLRTLESGAMLGVTPSALEFSAVDGAARVELNYADATTLIDYLGRINEGVSPGDGRARWTVIETRAQPDMASSNASLQGTPRRATSVATIRSTWDESPSPSPPR